jgi:hypothetical protein
LEVVEMVFGATGAGRFAISSNFESYATLSKTGTTGGAATTTLLTSASPKLYRIENSPK